MDPAGGGGRPPAVALTGARPAPLLYFRQGNDHLSGAARHESERPMVVTDQALITRHIEQHPRRRGEAEARLADSKIAVWAIVGYLRMVDGDVDRVASDYDLPRAAVEAALASYRRHRAPLDARLAANGS